MFESTGNDFHMYLFSLHLLQALCTACMSTRLQICHYKFRVQSYKRMSHHFLSPCVSEALNSMLISQAQALMKRQHCLEQAGSLL